jgi:hypothetical protein
MKGLGVLLILLGAAGFFLPLFGVKIEALKPIENSQQLIGGVVFVVGLLAALVGMARGGGKAPKP